MANHWRHAAKIVAAVALKSADDVDISVVIEQHINEPGQSSVKSALLTDYDRIQETVENIIQKQLQQEERSGLSPRFAFSDVAPSVLIRLKDSSFDAAVDEMNTAIEELNWRAFEHFSRHVLRNNGVMPCHVLRGTKEEGIDLCGIMTLNQQTPSAIWKDATIRVLGQVKKTRVGQRDIRLFNTDLSSCARGEGEGHRLSPEWFKKSKAPVLGFVFAFRGFTGKAPGWAKEHGILTKDSRQMIEDVLNCSRETPGVLKIGKTTQFHKDVFMKHFGSLR